MAVITGQEKSIAVKQVDCDTCTAACCRSGIQMRLNDSEADFMQTAGTDLTKEPGTRHQKRRLLPLVSVRHPETNVYTLENDCGHLTEDALGQLVCSSHEDPARPDTCKGLEPGSYVCRSIRVRAGVDTEGEWAAYLHITSQDSPQNAIAAGPVQEQPA